MDDERKQGTREEPRDKVGREARSEKTTGFLRGIAGALVNLLLLVVIGAASFYISTQYFTLKRSVVETVLATGLNERELTAYRSASGGLDKYAVSMDSPFISIPMAEKCTFLSRDGKAISLADMSIGSDHAHPVSVTILPDGTILKVKDEADLLVAEGEVLWNADGELLVQGAHVTVRRAMFLHSDVADAVDKEQLQEQVNPGDIVKVMGFSQEAAIVQLVERAGTLVVDCNVPEAKVYVDGQLRGKTPCGISVAPGERKVALKAAGYKPHEAVVLVESRLRATLSPSLQAIIGTLTVTSVPSGASVSLAGVAGGATPLTLDLPPGRYEMALEMEGYRPKEVTATVVGDRNLDVPVRLTKAPNRAGSTGGDAPKPEVLKFTLSGKVMARDGDTLYIGETFYPCRVSPGAHVEHLGASFSLGSVRPGDSVTVRGTTGSDIREVTVEALLKSASSFEAHLVQGSALFGEAGKLPLTLPPGIEVVDVHSRNAEDVREVPFGSRIRFSLGPSGDVVWAEYVWRADTSARGQVGLVSGASLFVMPHWEANTFGMSTQVYLEDLRTSFFDIKQGDTVTVAGPKADDIRFIWIENRIDYRKTISGVVTAQLSKQGKVFFERGLIPSGEAYPITVLPGTQFADHETRATVLSDGLEWGDRARLYLDSGGHVVWGEVTETCGERIAGRYLGEKDGVLIFTGYSPMIMKDDAVIQGLFGKDTLRVGAKVFAGGRNGHLTYLEVQENSRPGWTASGIVASAAKDALSVWAGETTTIQFAKDARFVDWESEQDGSLSELFPGDRVSIMADSTGIVYWAERTYSPRFRLEGTVLATQGRVLTVGDSKSSATVMVEATALVLRDGVRVDLSTLRKGDNVRLSGDAVGSIDVIVCGR